MLEGHETSCISEIILQFGTQHLLCVVFVGLQNIPRSFVFARRTQFFTRLEHDESSKNQFKKGIQTVLKYIQRIETRSLSDTKDQYQTLFSYLLSHF